MFTFRRHINMILMALLVQGLVGCASDSSVETLQEKTENVDPSLPPSGKLNLSVKVKDGMLSRSIVVGPNAVLNPGEERLSKIYVCMTGNNYGQYGMYNYQVNSISGLYEWATTNAQMTLSDDNCTLYASNIPMKNYSATSVPTCLYYNTLRHTVKDGVNEVAKKYYFNGKDTMMAPTDYLYAVQSNSSDSISGSGGKYYPLSNTHVDASLTFQHVNSLVKLSFYRGTYSGTGEIRDVRIVLQYPAAGTFTTDGTYSLSNGAIKANTSNPSYYSDSISWYNPLYPLDVLPAASEGTSDFTSFVSPYSVNSRFQKYAKFNLKFKVDKKEMELDDLPLQSGWKAGYIYEYKIKVNNMTLHLQSVDVYAWMPDIVGDYTLE